MCLSVKWGRCLTYRLSRKTEDGRCAGGHTSRPGLGASSEGSECSATDGVSAEAPHPFSGVAKERPPEYLVLLVIALKFPSALLPFKARSLHALLGRVLPISILVVQKWR